MSGALQLEFQARPSATVYMSGALIPSPGFAHAAGMPAMVARWRGHRADQRELRDFFALSGLPESAHLSLLYPHTFSFPLQMAILTHPRFPVPIWRVLQVRNRLLQLLPLEKNMPLDLQVSVAGRRILDKGAEVDLRVEAKADGQTVWEAVNTFYARGHFGPPTGTLPPPAPAGGENVVDTWQMPTGGGGRFGKLSGDFNPIHLMDWYARRHGFRRALFHPQRVLGHCLARLPAHNPTLPLRLDAWLKGPVYYASQVTLRATRDDAGSLFGLNMHDEPRPAIVGKLSSAQPDQRLADAA